MASSRWKRFAFFERHSLVLHRDVLQDLIPVDSDLTKSRRSIRSLQAAGQEVGDDSIGLVATTAALPLDSKPKLPNEQQQLQQQQQQQDGDAMTAMWSSLTACTSPNMTTTTTPEDELVDTIRLPSAPKGGESSSASSSTTAVDGLVLAFVTSRSTELIHCFDITARCNPPTITATDETRTQSNERLLEDLDGWRGYFAPFSFQPAVVERRTSQDIIHEHMMDETSSSAAANAAISDRVVAVATCRDLTGHKAVLVACIAREKVVVWEDPHLHLSCRLPLTCPKAPLDAKVYSLSTKWNASDGECRAVDVKPSLVAVGTTNGYVIVYSFDTAAAAAKKRTLRSYLRIPHPPSGDAEVVSVKLSLPPESGNENEDDDKASVTVSYRRKVTESTSASAGICCYEFPLPTPSSTTITAPSARHDLDGRSVASASLVDAFSGPHGLQFTVVGDSFVFQICRWLSTGFLFRQEILTISTCFINKKARLDGLYSYSKTERIGVAPIDGIKLSMSLIPPPTPAKPVRQVDLDEIGSGYALVASTDAKSGRDSVDIYDAHNKLVAFHLLLSPGHSSVRSAGITTTPTMSSDGTLRSGRSSAVVLTSGGQLVTFTEKLTAEKISLLVQKNLYSAAIVVAYADPSYDADDITNLYRQYAEHLYRKGDFGGAMDQYIHTIGSLESAHVLYRYLDAPKIPHLVKYLEQLRTRGLATPVHNELLRTCYLKINDTDAAEALAASGSRSMDKGSLATILAKIPTHPKEALATICSLEARQAAEVLVVHGASLARGLPREMAGVVISLCLGTYSPKSLADAALSDTSDLKRMVEKKVGEDEMVTKPYPVHLFASAFIEHPKLLRLILAHCNRNKCPLTSSLRRTLLELTLAEWNQAKRTGDTEAEKLRHKEAIAVSCRLLFSSLTLDDFFLTSFSQKAF